MMRSTRFSVSLGLIVWTCNLQFSSLEAKNVHAVSTTTNPPSLTNGMIRKRDCGILGEEACHFAMHGNSALSNAKRLYGLTTESKSAMLAAGWSMHEGIHQTSGSRKGKSSSQHLTSTRLSTARRESCCCERGVGKESEDLGDVLPSAAWHDDGCLDTLRRPRRSVVAQAEDYGEDREQGTDSKQQQRNVCCRDDAAHALPRRTSLFRMALRGGGRDRDDSDEDRRPSGGNEDSDDDAELRAIRQRMLAARRMPQKMAMQQVVLLHPVFPFSATVSILPV